MSRSSEGVPPLNRARDALATHRSREDTAYHVASIPSTSLGKRLPAIQGRDTLATRRSREGTAYNAASIPSTSPGKRLPAIQGRDALATMSGMG